MKDLRASNAYIMDRLFKKGFEGAQHELNWKPLLSTYRQIANRRCDRLENYASSIEITRLSFTIGVSPCNRKSFGMKVEREEKKEPREADRISHNHVVR